MAPRKTAASPPKRPWRENIESLAMAVVVALTLKYFILEISKIPSGSMQPTLMGSPETAVFDRVLVDKLSYELRDPRRFEVVVFKHPLERSRNMVKRVVGMPGEELKIENGDVWTRPEGEPDWRVLRRPADVQRSMWRALDPKGWTPLGDPIRLGEGASVRYTSPGVNTVVNHPLDGYPERIRRDLRGARKYRTPGEPVGDLRVEGRVQAAADCVAFVVEIREGARRYSFSLPGPAAPSGARPRLDPGAEGYGGSAPPPLDLEPYRLPAGRAIRFAAENLDDQLGLELDGRPAGGLELPAAPKGLTSIRMRVEDGSVLLHGLEAFRDVHYLPSREGPRAFEIPAGHFFMLGDNTQDSADSREWEAVRFTWRTDGDRRLSARGNLRLRGENPTPAKGPGGEPYYLFRDQWGERHAFPFPATGASQEDEGHAPLVPRDLIHGRVFAVFWPLKPWRGVWRLGWIR